MSDHADIGMPALLRAVAARLFYGGLKGLKEQQGFCDYAGAHLLVGFFVMSKQDGQVSGGDVAAGNAVDQCLGMFGVGARHRDDNPAGGP